MYRPTITYDERSQQFEARFVGCYGNPSARHADKRVLEDFLDYLENLGRIARGDEGEELMTVRT